MAFDKQAILSLCAGTTALIVFGSIYTFGALTPYISSYLYHKGHEISNTSLSILFTLTLITINAGVAISTTFFTKFSNRILCIIAIIGMSCSVLVSSFMQTFAGFVVFYGVCYGFSIGIGYFPPLKNCYLHLPNRKGLCSGICMSGFGLGSAIFNYIIVWIVNPHDIGLDSITKKYPIQVTNNVPFTLQILAIVYCSLGLLGSVFIIPPKQAKTVKNYTLLSQESSQTTIIKPQIKVQVQTFSSLIQIFKQKKAYWLIIQYAMIAPFGMFIAFNYKRIAFDRNSYFLQNDHLVTTIGSIGIICNGLFRSGWGYFFDHFSYKKITIAINIGLLIYSGLILFAVQNVVAYFFIIPMIYSTYGGLYALLPTQAVRVLGPIAGAKLFWLMFSGFSIAALIQFTIQFIFLTPAMGSNGYIYCIGIFFALQFFGLLITVFKKYQYQQSQLKLILGRKQNKQNIVKDNQKASAE